MEHLSLSSPWLKGPRTIRRIAECDWLQNVSVKRIRPKLELDSLSVDGVVDPAPLFALKDATLIWLSFARWAIPLDGLLAHRRCGLGR